MKKAAVFSLLLAAGAAYACTIVPSIVTPILKVGSRASTQAQWNTIATKLDDIYGNQFQDNEILSVRVPVQTCLFLVCGTSINTQFLKPCGQTLKEAADEIAEGLPSWNGGTGGVGDGYGGVGGSGGGSGGSGTNCYFKYTSGSSSAGGGPSYNTTVVDLVCA